MKHAFTLLLSLVFSSGLLTPAEAQTTALPLRLLPSPPVQTLKQVSLRKEAPVLNGTTATTIRYVKAGGTGTANGTSWSNASGDLQAMINASASGDQVWIAGGTYKPSTTGLSNPRTATFSLKNGVSVLGGFTGTAGTEGNVGARTAIPSSTTLSGDIGTPGQTSDNCYHVMFNNQNGLDASSVLDGFFITQGNADAALNSPDGFGGGIQNAISSPSIVNCQFVANNATAGGGLTNAVSTTRLVNCSFINNSAAFGAGFYSSASGGTLVNCYFYQNTANSSGGAIAFASAASTSTLTNCTFSGNTSSNSGAIITEANLTLTNCITWNNGGQNSLTINNTGGYSASYSLIEAGETNYTNGGNNQTLTTSPFDNATGPQLARCAPAVDAGNDAANTTTTDVLGNARKLRTIDIGAAEYQGAPYVAPTISNLFQSATTVCQGSQVSFSFDITGGSDGVTSANFYRDNTNLGNAGITAPAGVSGQVRRAFSINESGTYKFVAVSACSSLTITYAPITANPLPASYSVTGGGAYCAGGVGSVVGLSGSETGVNYQLLRAGTATGTPVAGTGNPITFGPQSTTGTYTVLATNTSTSCTQTMSGSAVVSVNALPTVSITPSATAVCQGQRATFAATPGLTSYRWSTPNNGPVLTTATISASIAGTYSLTVTNASGCTATTQASLTVNPLPPVTITPSATTICAGQSTTLTASGATIYKWSTEATTATISVSVAGPYSVTGTNTTTGCSNTAIANVMVTPLPNASFTGLPASVCVDAAPSSLSPVTPGGTFSGTGISGNQFNPASAGAGGPYSITYTVSSMGCSNSSIQQVTVNPLPVAPIIATQSGHSYPGGVSSLTISQNTGNVILMTSGCMGGTITWAGGASSTLAVSTMNTGVQTFTATCTSNTTGCTSPKATATVTVVGTTLSVLHRDGNGQINTNTLAPYLELQNDGNTAIPYSEITVRYWLTVENYMPLLFSINYAQVGSDKVHLKYVPASTGNPTATGYVEFSFDASAGSLGAMSNSGPIQDLINKQDYSSFDQSNDYSYVNTGQYTPNLHITAYRNGVIFYGMEPGPVVSMQSVRAMLQNNTGADANSIEAVLSVTNDGNVPINYGDIKVRYYFTADNTQPLVLNQVGYTALGSSNVSAQIVTISPALAGADRYLELSFSPSLGQLAPGASTGGVTYQIRHADYSGFNQTNDYSYQGTGGTMINPHVVVFVAGARAYGTEPGTGGRLSAEEAGKLTVQVLGNPVRGSAVEVMVSGAEGQALTLHLTDLSGRSVTTRQVERAGATESQRLEVGNASAGMLLLRVSTPAQSQTVKVLRQ